MLGRGATAADLEALISRVWPGSLDSSGPLLVTRGQLPVTHRMLEEYLIVPNATSPALLVPSRSPASALALYAAAKPGRVEWLARAGGLLYSTSLGSSSASRLRVGVKIDSAGDDPPSLLSALAGALGRDGLLACMPVRRERPGTKPIMVVFDETDSPAAWVKVGWSPLTQALVRHEHQTLLEVSGRLPGLAAPTPIASGAWRELTYAVSEAVPGAATRWTQPPEAAPQILAKLAATGEQAHGRLATSSYARSIEATLVATAGAEPEVTRVLGALLERLKAEDCEITFGRSHGDWVPWNLGKVADTLFAWDWEHSQPNSPMGFDLLHWHFQTTLAQTRTTLADAVHAADSASQYLAALALSPSTRQTTVSLYVLDMFLRGAILAAQGGGWNHRLRHGMLEVAAQLPAA